MSGGLYGDRLTVVDTRIKGTGTVVTNLNADKLDGYHASVTPGAATIPVSGGGGLIADGWLSFMDSSGVANTEGRCFMVSQNATLAVIAASKTLTYLAQG